MTDAYSSNYVIRTTSGEALSAQPDLRERLEAAAAAEGMVVSLREDGVEVAAADRAAAERMVDNPNINFEAASIYLDMSALGSNCRRPSR